jgi:hypothetical protein
MAIPLVSVGRTIEQTGNLRLRKFVGSDMIELVTKHPVGIAMGETARERAPRGSVG